MNEHSELQLLLRFLKNHKINTYFYTDNTNLMDIDLHLRQLLGGEQEYKLLEDFLSKSHPTNIIYKLIDSLSCIYYFIYLPDQDVPSPLIIGPYVQTRLNKNALLRYIETYSIPPQTAQRLLELLYQIPVLMDDTSIQTMIQSFGEGIWGSTDNFHIQILDQNLDDVPSYIPPFAIQYEDILSPNMLYFENYLAQENNLIYAVSQGQTSKAEEILAEIDSSVFAKSSYEMLRNIKNYAMILNTLLRKHAEINLIDTNQIIQTYFKFAYQIEQCTSPESCTILIQKMIRRYCLLVKNHSMKQYSVLIRQTIKIVNTDLTADLSLKTVAKELNVSANYLSTQFKKVTGTSYTEYVNRKRLDHALFLLNTTSLQIQTIAEYCGIPDLNYFCKLFKKYIHKSPTSYRKDLLDK